MYQLFRTAILKSSFIFLAMLLLFSTTLLYAQDPAAVPAVDSFLPEDQVAAPTDRLYLDFKGASLLNVLVILSELSGINFVAGKEVAGREVNMVLDDVVLEDVLEAISKGTNVTYDYIPNRNIYLFRAAADAEANPMLVTRVFKLYYIRASQLREIDSGSTGGGSSSSSGFSAGSLTETEAEASSQILTIVENILSERGKVNVDDRSNSLVITDTEDRLQMIEQAIVELDRPLEQVLIEAILIETLEDFDRFLGVDWTAHATGNIFTLEGAGPVGTRFPFNFFSGQFIERVIPGGTDGILDKTDIADTSGAPAAATAGSKTFEDLDIAVKMLQTANKVRVIAKPKILVLDNHPALIKITTNAAIGGNTQQAATGQLTSTSSTSTERAEVGTLLRLTPLINTNNRITLTIEPSFSSVAQSTLTLAAGGNTISAGDVTVRAARTTLMLNDGQIIAMGGLLQSSQSNTTRKMPIAGDLPFLGEIFTRRTRDLTDRELLLFVSPHIVRDPSEVQAAIVPDERDRFDDEAAPFWRVKRKPWYRKIVMEAKPESSKIEGRVIAAREQAMDDTLEILASEPQEQPI